MAKSNANYSILVDVELQTKQIQDQLDKTSKKARLNVTDNGGTKKLKEDAQELELQWQQAQYVMSECLKVINSMVDEVYSLNSAMIEFQKVSDLSGQGLEDYLDKLSEMGKEVARTGRPLCLSRKVRMVNVL
mgnify:CR=1 FL=1|nr:MAG TPA: hypothetical protein [Caudoviricetes sp.]